MAQCACVAVLLIAVARLASTQETMVTPGLAAEINRIVTPYIVAGDFMGVVAVQRDGEAPLIVPYGLASVELSVPHRATDIFMIGSVSKQFTAVAILLLEQEGMLKTSDTVSRYLPDLGHGEQITIEQLLTHTSGVADIYSLESFGETAGREGTFKAIIGELGRTELSHRPGSAYVYSNGGYALLAAIIERASAISYGGYLARQIFDPLGMTSTSHDKQGPAVEKRVPGYDPWGRDGLTSVAPTSAAYTTGSGSLWSSAADLLIWTSALHGGRLLTAASYEKLTRDYGHGYGYGVSVFKRFERDVVGHDGRLAGYASDVARYLEDRITVVVLSNVQSVARDEIRRSVAAAVFGESFAMPEKQMFLDQQQHALDELVGVYSFGPGFEVSVSESDGRLLARANEGGYSELVPSSDEEWFSRMLYATVRFGRDEAGLIDRLIWGRGDQAPAGRQLP